MAYIPMPIVTPIIIPTSNQPIGEGGAIVLALCIVLMVVFGALGAVINWLRSKGRSDPYYGKPDPVGGMLIGAMVGLMTPIVVGAFAILYKAIQ